MKRYFNRFGHLADVPTLLVLFLPLFPFFTYASPTPDSLDPRVTPQDASWSELVEIWDNGWNYSSPRTSLLLEEDGTAIVSLKETGYFNQWESRLLLKLDSLGNWIDTFPHVRNPSLTDDVALFRHSNGSLWEVVQSWEGIHVTPFRANGDFRAGDESFRHLAEAGGWRNQLRVFEDSTGCPLIWYSGGMNRISWLRMTPDFDEVLDEGQLVESSGHITGDIAMGPNDIVHVTYSCVENIDGVNHSLLYYARLDSYGEYLYGPVTHTPVDSAYYETVPMDNGALYVTQTGTACILLGRFLDISETLFIRTYDSTNQMSDHLILQSGTTFTFAGALDTQDRLHLLAGQYFSSFPDGEDLSHMILDPTTGTVIQPFSRIQLTERFATSGIDLQFAGFPSQNRMLCFYSGRIQGTFGNKYYSASFGHGFQDSIVVNDSLREFSADTWGTPATLRDFTSVYPNPFNSTINIKINARVSGDVSVSCYNILGSFLFDRTYRVEPGHATLSIPFKDQQGFSTGVYFLSTKFMNQTEVFKIQYIK